MRITQKNKGYSLLELLIYIALFAVISIVLVRSLIVVMRTYASAQANRRLQNNGELIMERITREVRDAESISSGTFGTNPGVLALSGEDGNTTFSVVSDAVQVNDDGTIGALSTNKVSVTSLVFRRITTPVGEGVKIELTLTTANAVIKSASFYSTALLRQ